MADKDDFFTDDEVKEEPQEEPEKIKLGEKEYTQDELSKLVGLGETAAELEDKWNTDIKKLYPEYTKSRQELSELRKSLEEKEALKQQEVQNKATAGEQLSQEEQAQLVKQELAKYGVITKEEVNTYIANFMAGQRLVEDIDGIITEAKDTGKPVTTREALLDYMDDNGVKNPEAAYRLMFDSELKEWEKRQIDSLKRPGLETESSSSAGSKQPAPVKVTRENLGDLLKSALAEE